MTCDPQGVTYGALLRAKGVQLNTGRHKGTSRTTPVLRDDGPGVSGTTTEHWDGRQDATCTAPSVTLTPAGMEAAYKAHKALTEGDK